MRVNITKPGPYGESAVDTKQNPSSAYWGVSNSIPQSRDWSDLRWACICFSLETLGRRVFSLTWKSGSHHWRRVMLQVSERPVGTRHFLSPSPDVTPVKVTSPAPSPLNQAHSWPTFVPTFLRFSLLRWEPHPAFLAKPRPPDWFSEPWVSASLTG